MNYERLLKDLRKAPMEEPIWEAERDLTLGELERIVPAKPEIAKVMVPLMEELKWSR